MAISGNIINLIENYEVQDFEKLLYLKNFVIISRNILGNQMPVLCYNLDNMTENDIQSKGSKIINDLLFIAYRKAIDNNNYNDIAALTICLYKYEGQFSWLGSVFEQDQNGNPIKIQINRDIVGGDIPSPSNFIKFAEQTDQKNLMDYFLPNSNDYNLAKNLYDSLIINNDDPISLENFGKLYALFGLVLLKQKEDTQRTLYIGFKQLQAVSLNYKNPYLPCE